MKKIEDKISAVEKFSAEFAVLLAKHHSQILSENAKRAWKLRKERSTSVKSCDVN